MEMLKKKREKEFYFFFLKKFGQVRNPRVGLLFYFILFILFWVVVGFGFP
jgi:hypothetical protein